MKEPKNLNASICIFVLVGHPDIDYCCIDRLNCCRALFGVRQSLLLATLCKFKWLWLTLFLFVLSLCWRSFANISNRAWDRGRGNCSSGTVCSLHWHGLLHNAVPLPLPSSHCDLTEVLLPLCFIVWVQIFFFFPPRCLARAWVWTHLFSEMI